MTARRVTGTRCSRDRAGLGPTLVLALLFATSSGALAQQPVSIAVIAHPTVPVERLNAAELAAIFSGSMKNWKGGAAIKLFNGPPGMPLRIEFDAVVLHMTPDQMARFWIDKRIRGDGTPPRQVPSADLAHRLVATFPGAISYVPSDKVTTGVRVVARIHNGQVVNP